MTDRPTTPTLGDMELTLREAAKLSLMYLETGFIECPQCGEEVSTKEVDAVWQLKDGLSAAPASPIPTSANEGEVLAREVLIDLICVESPTLFRDGVRDAVEKDMIALCSKPSRVVRAMLAYGRALSPALDDTAVEGQIRSPGREALACAVWNAAPDRFMRLSQCYPIADAIRVLLVQTGKAR
jgi:hypothetical protein